jgi:hypothetical protein
MCCTYATGAAHTWRRVIACPTPKPRNLDGQIYAEPSSTATRLTGRLRSGLHNHCGAFRAVSTTGHPAMSVTFPSRIALCPTNKPNDGVDVSRLCDEGWTSRSTSQCFLPRETPGSGRSPHMVKTSSCRPCQHTPPFVRRSLHPVPHNPLF